mmetsp:Transcript_4127/g.10423  ORF Transcript_4127/g.10423 Transcript_4127/m.10423 type:complete len:304 (+) Transcript_4127:781-1692(+)
MARLCAEREDPHLRHLAPDGRPGLDEERLRRQHHQHLRQHQRPRRHDLCAPRRRQEPHLAQQPPNGRANPVLGLRRQRGLPLSGALRAARHRGQHGRQEEVRLCRLQGVLALRLGVFHLRRCGGHRLRPSGQVGRHRHARDRVHRRHRQAAPLRQRPRHLPPHRPLLLHHHRGRLWGHGPGFLQHHENGLRARGGLLRRQHSIFRQARRPGRRRGLHCLGNDSARHHAQQGQQGDPCQVWETHHVRPRQGPLAIHLRSFRHHHGLRRGHFLRSSVASETKKRSIQPAIPLQKHASARWEVSHV